jgi:LAS superfamily LD-carboxypeptidase LdcB
MTKIICGQTRNNGDIDDLLTKIKPELFARHSSTVNQSDNKQIRLQPLAMKSLEDLLTDAYNQGILIKVNSAYRTYGDQLRIKQSSSTIPCATPGWSNHGFGLAVDLANSTGARINPSSTPKEWKWIQANKDKYYFNNINTTTESHHFNFTQIGKIC